MVDNTLSSSPVGNGFEFGRNSRGVSRRAIEGSGGRSDVRKEPVFEAGRQERVRGARAHLSYRKQ